MPALTVPSQATLDLIKAREGLRLKAYQDGGGVWTLGYGATGPGIVKGTAWTTAQAEADLLKRVLEFTAEIFKLLKVAVTPNQLTALTSLIYNIGAGAFATSSVLRKLNAGDIPGAADAFLLWNKDNGKVVPGLVTRRAAEREIFLGQ